MWMGEGIDRSSLPAVSTAEGKEHPRTLLIILAVALCARLALIPFVDFHLDDAYITFRVAANAAAGFGPVFNPGERVLSVTTPLYAMLMIPGELVGIGAPLWSRLVNSLAGSAACALFYALLRGRVRERILVPCTLYLALNPFTLTMTLTGMESPVFYMLVLMASLLYLRKRAAALGTVLGLLSITRPEGAVIAALFAVTAVLTMERRMLPGLLLPMSAVFLGWAAYSWHFFGCVVPNSFLAKKAYFEMNPTPLEAQIRAYTGFTSMAIPLAPAMLLFLPAGVVRAVSRDRGLLPLAAGVTVVLAAQLASPFYLAFWYVDMMIPLILAVLLPGFDAFLGRLAPGVDRFLSRTPAMAGLCAVLAVGAGWAFYAHRAALSDLRNLDIHMGRLADWFEDGRRPRGTICIEAIGRIGYDTGFPVLDCAGLASPRVVPLIAENRADMASLMDAFQPDYCITGRMIPPEAVPDYAIAAVLPAPQSSRRGFDTETYIYARLPGP